MKSQFALLFTLLVAACVTQAQQPIRSAPQPTAIPAAIELPQDRSYPGAMTLAVDATDIEHRIFRVRQSIPVVAGPMVLLYPRWVAGAHSPSGPVHNFAGLKITGRVGDQGGDQPRSIPWTRDPVDSFAYHLEVPTGVTKLEIEAQYLTPTETAQGGIAITNEMLRLNWYAAALYPAGYFARRIDVNASVQLPKGWQFATALETISTQDQQTQFRTVSFETLIDSPLIAGKHFKKIDLDPNGRSRVTLNVVADEKELLATSAAIDKIHRELVHQMDLLYGARHFDHYDFLLTLSEKLAGMGVEHQRSSDNGTSSKYFTAWENALVSRDLLAHEYNHSWNGKYRRPADLWTPSPQVPMRGSLLWVYEGQTQYFGNVLAARAGFLNKQQALDSLALTAATHDLRVGRAWRNLQDTTNDPLMGNRRAIPWQSWQRGEDYYQEGQLIWLEVDTLLRERSKNRHSLDDFARAFFGMNDGDWGQLTYTFEDIVATLNKIEPFDWASLLRSRLDENPTGAPLTGIKRGGYELLYSETQSEFGKSQDARRRVTDFTFSLGMTLDNKGKFTAVQWDGPAFKAGLIVGNELIAVNGVAYEADRLKALVKASLDSNDALEFLIKQGDAYRTIRIDYHGGARYPKLERLKGTPALLDDILAPRK